jgi:phosphinothricin acetyltransferase
MMQIRDAKEVDLPAIIDIYNSTIDCHLVTGDVEPVSIEGRRDWFESHTPDRRPLWVMDAEGTVAGWLGFQSFYGRPAYDTTAELSVYIAPRFRRQGIGRLLLQQAIAKSPGFGIKTLLGFIFADNDPSLCLFEQFGFDRWGYLPGVARFDGDTRDLVIVGLRLD